MENLRQIRTFNNFSKSARADTVVFFSTRIKKSADKIKNSNFLMTELMASVAGAVGVAKWQTHRT
jgi:hypothetical protein